MKHRLLFVIVCILVTAPSAHAQQDTLGYAARNPEWAGQFATLSANAALGGVTAGLFQLFRGGSFKDGFTRGALGGTIIYAGKRVAAERFDGAGLIGREVASIGASVVRNASDGIGSFDRIVLPVGIGRLYWNRPQHDLRFKLDLITTGFLVYAIVEDELEFEAVKSISAGSPVFRTDNKIIAQDSGAAHAAGISRSGLVLRADVPAWGSRFLKRAFAHERIHTLQDDQIFLTLTDPFEDWVLSKLGPLAKVSRYVDVNTSSDVISVLSDWIERHRDRPWELEAIYLTTR